MQKILATLLTLTILGVFVPTTSAAESVSTPYNGAIGYYLGPLPGHGVPDVPSGRGLALVLCPSGCDLNELCENVPEVGETCLPNTGLLPTVAPIGGAELVAAEIYTNVIVSLTDDVFGSGAAVSACFWNPDGDNTCFNGGENADYGSDWVCGSVPLLNSPFAASEVTVWALTVLVSEDLDVCGATAGTITGDFF